MLRFEKTMENNGMINKEFSVAAFFAKIIKGADQELNKQKQICENRR